MKSKKLNTSSLIWETVWMTSLCKWHSRSWRMSSTLYDGSFTSFRLGIPSKSWRICPLLSTVKTRYFWRSNILTDLRFLEEITDQVNSWLKCPVPISILDLTDFKHLKDNIFAHKHCQHKLVNNYLCLFIGLTISKFSKKYTIVVMF